MVACDWLKHGAIKEVWRCEIPPPQKKAAGAMKTKGSLAMKAMKAKAMKTKGPLAMKPMKAAKATRPQAMQATKTPKAKAKQ